MSDRYGSISINLEKPKQKIKPPPAEPKPVPGKKPGGKRPSFFLLLPLLFIFLFLGASRYLVPVAIQKYLPSYVENNAGLILSIGRVEINPLNFQLTMTDVTANVPEATTEKPLLYSPRLFVDMDLTSLLRNSFVCNRLTVTKPEINIVRFTDKSYNLPVLSPLTEEEGREEIIDFTNLPFLFSINNIDINDGSILFTDNITKKNHTVEKLHLAVPTFSNFSFQAKNYIQPYFSAIINGSKVELNGKTEAMEDGENFKTKLNCSIKGLDLVPYNSYIPAEYPWTLTMGEADIDIEIDFTSGVKEHEHLAIDLKLNGSRIFLRAKTDKSKISIPAIQLDGTVIPVSREFHVRTLIARKPQLVSHKELLTEWLHALITPGTPKSKRPLIKIDMLLLDQGRLVIKNGKDSIWNSLQCTVKDFNNTSTAGNFRISGEHATGAADFSWQGKFLKNSAMQGKLMLNDFPADFLSSQFFQASGLSVSGDVEFAGILTVEAPENSINYNLDDSSMEFKNIVFGDDKDEWMKTDSIRFTGVSRQKNRFNLGNIFIKGAEMHLQHGQYPVFFKHLSSGKKHPLLKGIDFTGDIFFRPLPGNDSSVHLTETRFQAAKLDQKEAGENFTFKGKLDSGATVQAKGNVNLNRATLQAEMAFAGLGSDFFRPFLSSTPFLNYSKATMEGKGSINYPSPVFLGTVWLSEGLLQVDEKKPLIRWDKAELKIVKWEFSPFSLDARELILNNPEILQDFSVQFPPDEFKSGLKTLLEAEQSGNKLLPFQIEKLTLNGARIPFEDKRLSPRWVSTAHNVNGYINNFNTIKEKPSSFILNGILEGADFKISGVTGLKENDSQIELSINNFPLTVFAEQLADRGLDIEKSTVMLNSRFDGQSTVPDKTTVEINPITSSRTDSSALALALLKDNSGKLKLSIETDKSRRSLFQAVIDHFQTNAIKASYAPLLLDPDFSDLQDNNHVSFQTGSDKITAGGKELLIRHSELLASHPAIGLSVNGSADSETDRAELQKKADQLEQQRVAHENEIRRQAQLESRKAVGNTGKAASDFIPLEPNSIRIDDNNLQELATERAITVYDFCVHNLGIAKERITIDETNKITTEQTGGGADIRLIPL